MSSDRPRLVRLTPVPPGPVADLKDALRGLYLSAQPATLIDIRDAIDRLDTASATNPALTIDSIPEKDAIHAVLRDPTLPASVAHVVAVAAGLLHRHRTVPELEAHGTVRGNPDVERVRRLWEVAALYRPPGRPITEITPRDLMVSRALGDAGLPPYVRRAHDDELHDVVAAADGGRSGTKILVSDSTSGKTRACYEALEGLGDGWRVWPLSGGPAGMLAEIPRLVPRTVVWLDEAQEYLLRPPEADEIATALHALLGDPDRAPVLVLGTAWPEHRDALLQRSASRRFLEGSFVGVPDTFDERDCEAALDTGDPHLAEAVRRAEGGAVVQYLAGVPDLLERVAGTSAPSRALLEAAGDARRFDHPEDLPRPLLIAAAPGYLDARERRRLTRSPDWATTAFASLTWLGRGDMSPLHPSRDGDCYQLEDYLDQTLERTRRTVPPPAAFWDACREHTPLAHASRLGWRAWERFLYDHAIALHRRAAEAGDAGSLARWARILRVRDDLDGLVELAGRRPEAAVFLQLAALYAGRDDADGSRIAWESAEAAGHRGPAPEMDHVGRADPGWAARKWRDWTAEGLVAPLTLVHALDALGRTDEAIAECRACLDGDARLAGDALLTLYDRKGGDDAVRELLDEMPQLGREPLHPVVRRLRGTPLPEPPPWRDARTVAEELHGADDLDGLRRHALEHPDKVIHRLLADLLLTHGHDDEARELTEHSIGATRGFAEHLLRAGRWHDLGRCVAEGNRWAARRLHDVLDTERDLPPVARRIKLYGLEPDGTVASAPAG